MIGIFSNLREYKFDNEFLVGSLATYLSEHNETAMVSVSPSVCIPVCDLALKTGLTEKFRIVSPCEFDPETNTFANPKLTAAFNAYFRQYGGSIETLAQFLFEGGQIIIGDPVRAFFKCPRVLQFSRMGEEFKFDNCKISVCDPFENKYMSDISKTIVQTKGDVLSFERWDTVVHCANLYHQMGAGVARTIADRFPWALAADKKTVQGDLEKLGTFSIGESPEKDKRIINLYGQKGIGNNGHPLSRNARYDALFDGLYLIFERAATKDWKVAIPYKIASDRAGGDWDIVKAIIKSAWKENPVETYIVEYEP